MTATTTATPRHPARYSRELLPVLAEFLDGGEAPRLRHGANAEARVDGEFVFSLTLSEAEGARR